MVKDEQEASALKMDEQPLFATNQLIHVIDGLVAGDVYDVACEIFGNIGMRKIFDRLNTGVELLENKTHWSSQVGFVDIFKTADSTTITPAANIPGSGYFVLPRYVDSILKLNIDTVPLLPQNRWFEFHLNGMGETQYPYINRWKDAFYTPIINGIPLLYVANAQSRTQPGGINDRPPIPQNLICICENSADAGAWVRVFGLQLMPDGTQQELMDEDGNYGIAVDCQLSNPTPTTQNIVSITRITKQASQGFIRMYNADQSIIFGMWYPDELEPKYRAIEIPSNQAHRVRIQYRRKTKRLVNMWDTIHLRSRMAMEYVMRSMKAMESDPNMAAIFEEKAVKLMEDIETIQNPTDSISLEFDTSISPGLRHSIM